MGLKLTPRAIEVLIQQQAGFICDHQLPSGAIPWYHGGITDPWDHIECAIALDIAGRFDEAKRAYLWLSDVQNPDGSWYLSYMNDKPQDLTRDTNNSSYLACGLLCHYTATRDMEIMREMWPVLDKAISFTLSLQQSGGEICWAYDTNNIAYPLALLASSCCIWQSLMCGVRIAKLLGIDKPEWSDASQRLLKAINEHPTLFHGSGDKRYEYAMSWYYPVLAGTVNGERAKEHLLGHWQDFVIDGWGCKCVVEAPWWVTVAETCELSLALARIGEYDMAGHLLEWIFKLRDSDGRFFTGIKIPEGEIWPPQEKPTWVAAAVVMATTAQMRQGLRGVLFAPSGGIHEHKGSR